MQLNYEEMIQGSINVLLDAYEKAPVEILQKYDLLFSYVLKKKERKPITNNRFSFYPSTGRIISSCGKHIIQLSPVQNEIFYLVAKSFITGNHINQEILYNYVYQNNSPHHSQAYDRPRPNTLKIHIYKINIKLFPLNMMIRHKMDFGWSIRTEKDDIRPMTEIKYSFCKSRSFN